MKLRFAALVYTVFFFAAAFVFGSSDSNEIINEDGHEGVKSNFMLMIERGDAEAANEYTKAHPFLVASFNRDIFSKFITYYNRSSEEGCEQCEEILQLLEPSFKDVSRSTTTPLIQAIRDGDSILVSKLLRMDEILASIDNVDEFGRTALMYAAKRGSSFIVTRILNISEKSLNFKDGLGKTVLHYACEMNSPTPVSLFNYLRSDLLSSISGEGNPEVTAKYDIIRELIARGATVDRNAPEYKLNSNDSVVIQHISNLGGRVSVKDTSDRLFQLAVLALTLPRFAHKFKLDISFLYIVLANPVSSLLNNICFAIQDLVIPNSNLSFNVSIESGDSIHDFRVSLLFVLILIKFGMTYSKQWHKNFQG